MRSRDATRAWLRLRRDVRAGRNAPFPHARVSPIIRAIRGCLPRLRGGRRSRVHPQIRRHHGIARANSDRQKIFETRSRAAARHGECPARARHGCRAGGQIGPSRHADGHGRDRRCPVGASPQASSRQSGLGRPRPLRALQWARLDAALRAAAPLGLRPADRGAQTLSSVAFEDAGTSGTRLRAGGRDHHRAAGSGHLERRRHGAFGAPAGGRVQPTRARHRRSPHLRVSRRSITPPGSSPATAVSWKACRTKAARWPAHWRSAS